ncbi:MAG: ClbS/DfsB family four-helix bundle protein [Calditrichia bacterium]
MPRPKNKADLLERSKQNYTLLFELINSLSDEERNADFPNLSMQHNIRDMLSHLHHWHVMMLDWYEVGMAGEKPDMPAKGYTWKTLPDLNQWIREQYLETSLDEITTLINTSFKHLREITEKHSDEELFTKKLYKWTGSTSLGEYLISNTCSHYDWAIKLMKRYKKSLK